MRNYRTDFPIFTNNPNLIYLDSAATSQKPQVVIDAIEEYYKTYNANIRRGLYPIAERVTKKVLDVRTQVAKLINAKEASEIIFVRNTTEAINLVCYTWGRENIKKGDTIVTTIMEHHSNFVPWQQLCEEKKAKFEVLDIDNNYQLSIPHLEMLLKKGNVKLLTLTYMSNVLGTINPIKKIIKIARQYNKDIIVLIDCAQAVPHIRVDVQDLDADFIAFSGHKMMAATGVGVLFGKKKLLDRMPPFLFGGDMIRTVAIDKTTFSPIPEKFEAGTPDIAGIISMGSAIDYLNSVGIEKILDHENKLVTYGISRLLEISGVKIYRQLDTDNKEIKKSAYEYGGIITFSIPGIHAHDIAQVLGDMNICIRAGHHCAMPLHTKLQEAATSRASFYLYNDEYDIDQMIQGVQKVKKIFSST